MSRAASVLAFISINSIFGQMKRRLPARLDAPSSETVKARSDLVRVISQAVRSWGLTQAVAAKRLGITQPRVNDLLRGRADKFSLDGLINLATRAELNVRLQASSLVVGAPDVGAPSLSENPTSAAIRSVPTNKDKRKQ
jgi:predicted XRE-type DNA-binding protein